MDSELSEIKVSTHALKSVDIKTVSKDTKSVDTCDLKCRHMKTVSKLQEVLTYDIESVDTYGQ